MRRKPTHPGRMLKNILERDKEKLPFSIFVGFDGKVDFYVWMDFINEKCSITPLMAEILAKDFDMSPEAWLNAQKNYDKWMEENNESNN